MTKKRRTYLPRIVGDKVMDAGRSKAPLQVHAGGHIDYISAEMREVGRA